MSDRNMSDRAVSDSWKTKWGARRVRHDPPTLAEALAAAQGFTDDRAAQAEIAAELMGVPVAEAEIEMRRMAPAARRATETVVAPARDKGGVRTVIIERKTSRRLQPATRRPNAVTRPG